MRNAYFIFNVPGMSMYPGYKIRFCTLILYSIIRNALNGVIFSSPTHMLLNFGQTAILLCERCSIQYGDAIISVVKQVNKRTVC